MDLEQLKQLLRGVAAKEIDIDAAVARLRRLPFESIDGATVDHHRALRCGHPEVIFCPGKTAGQVVAIAQRLAAEGGCVLATRGSDEQLAAMRQAFPEAVIDQAARAVLVKKSSDSPVMRGDGPQDGPYVAVVSAGTADGPVAAEAMITLRAMGARAKQIQDVGVSGLHRLLGRVEEIQQACAVVVVAGMEGALPSVVGGLVACPVYAVPSSIGYGASLGGLAAMLGMLTSCASNVSVVNIDNGFGAAYSAALVWRQVEGVAHHGEHGGHGDE